MISKETCATAQRFNDGEIGVLAALEAARETCAAISKLRWQSALKNGDDILSDWCEPTVGEAIRVSIGSDAPSDMLCSFYSSETFWKETGKAITQLDKYTGEESPFVELCTTLLLAERQAALARFGDIEYCRYTHA